METRSIEWEKDRKFTKYQVRATDLKKYNNLITSGKCSTNYPKDSWILYLVGATQNIMDESKNTPESFNKE